MGDETPSVNQHRTSGAVVGGQLPESGHTMLAASDVLMRPGE